MTGPAWTQSLEPLKGMDAEGLDRQTWRLREVQRSPERRTSLLHRLADRCTQAAFPVDVLYGEGRAPVAVARGQVITRGSLPRSLQELVSGPSRVAPGVECFDCDDLARVLRQAKEEGVDAAPNHVVPLNWTVKAKVGPERTDRRMPELEVKGGPRPLVVAVDTGIASGKARNRDDGWLEDVDGDEDPLDETDPHGHLDLGAGHGTSVAGIIQQVAPSARIVVLRGMRANGVGDEVAIAESIRRAAEHIEQHIKQEGHPGVINLSLGESSYCDREPLAMKAALDELPKKILVVAAAGNGGDDRPWWPAAFERVIAVAGLTRDLTRADWSSHGSWVGFSTVAEGLASPFVIGQETPGTADPGDPFDLDPDTWTGPNPNAMWTGTSFAAPQVAARLATFLAEGEAPKEAVHRLRSEAERHIEGFGHAVRIL